MDTFNATTYSLLVILLAICTYIVWFYKKAFTYWKLRGLEYLEPRIPFGNSFNVYAKKCSFGEIFAQWYLQLKEKGVKHGGAYMFWKPVYIPVDPEIIKRILITDFEYFPNRGFYTDDEVDPLLGHLFSMENLEWKNLRSKIPASFTSAKMRKMFVILESMNKQFKKNLDTYSVTSRPVNIKTEIVRLTTDTSLSCLLGIDTKTLNHENEEMITQGRSFFDSHFNIYTNTITLMVPGPILKKLKFRVLGKELEKYFMEVVRNITDYRSKSDSKREDLTDTLIRLSQKDVQERGVTGENLIQPLTFKQLTAQLCALFAASFETSSSTMTFAAYELARNPDCQIKLREDIEKVLAKHDNKLTYDALMGMKYLENVVDETLRLYPVFPILPRACVKDYKVPGTDFTIEKNTFVMVSNMGIHRDPEYYPNPNKFDPERFSSDNKASRPFAAYLPFGEGPRICVGKRFGLMQTKLGILTMVRNYEITLNEKTTQCFKFEPDELVLRKTGDIWINLKKL